MIKRFDEYIKEEFEGDEDDYTFGTYHGEIETIEDIDVEQLNKLPPLYKNRYKVMIEYDITLPDKGDEETEAVVRRVVEAEIKKLNNKEVRIDAIHKLDKRI